MIVVADTSPFVVLVNIGCIHVLPTLFTEILIPPRVALELASPRRPEGVKTFIASSPDWLQIVTPSSTEVILGLAEEETAAITLAMDVRAGGLQAPRRVMLAEATGGRVERTQELRQRARPEIRFRGRRLHRRRPCYCRRVAQA